SAITTVFVSLALNNLPRLYNPLRTVPNFHRATDDRFFIAIYAKDKKYDAEEVDALLRSTGPLNVSECVESTAQFYLPGWTQLAFLVTIVALAIPPALIARSRFITSELPRIHVVPDMDFQPKFKAQSPSTLFADGRSMRPELPGVIARGAVVNDPVLLTGLVPGITPEGQPGMVESPDFPESWLAAKPLDEWMARGQERYNIYCAACHGLTGAGNGMVAKRALDLAEGTWVPPVTYHNDPLRNAPIGHFFTVVTNGVRKMPSYASQIAPEDRWAIALYVRALQRSQNGTLEDVPADVRPTLGQN
ncbi:MAG: quinol:electron acceptor oxidoreductase subunit ActD, partial [Planctomycetia bacterium]